MHIIPTGKSDKDHNEKEDDDKYLIDEVLEKFNETLNTHINKNQEAFLLHHILGYLKEACIDYGSMQWLWKLLKNFENELAPFLSVNFDTVHSSTMNQCEYSAAILKWQGVQGKYHVRSVINFMRRNAKTMTFTEFLKIPEDKLGKTRYLDRNSALI